MITEPLTVDELRKLGKLVGDLEQLVAPKRRAEAVGLAGEKLLAWLAADGGRVRRPIVVAGKTVTLGFAGDAREKLEAILP